MDSRPVNFPTEAYCESLSRCRKVKNQEVPVDPICDGLSHPVIRFIGHPDLPRNDVC